MILEKSLTEPLWLEILAPLFSTPGFASLERFIESELAQGKSVYPTLDNVFAALNPLPPPKVQVVILGQDPYHQPGQAHGLCFSVPKGHPAPPSLVNIFTEIERTTGRRPQSPNLAPWVAQGVLLLNTVLTVTESRPGSHKNKGWEPITDRIITTLSQRAEPVIFLLWGAFAQGKRGLINLKVHKVLEAPHPSPLSAHRGFFGCNHFQLANQLLAQQGKPPILWA
ncbi:MAG: uracil-DNA glycosylase [Candidatus Lambdaproteobacteria bacterium RIFOXYD1_FULL_56_27]|uniref:Uracil-DNA glycosylase n=1 Tax=Candidatus Lambdaproteobacteria bacterium RIFOXYD2_FULL_56_26 TaxID=1817773 RepID=A0A1F6GMI3_9PROT|nr:MAG: uracil-DNA glycosylase [Candidatus Lambdaproteobacteria bacterium RIFOXYD2_FULL_56_26]OGH03299.1 MAG: uracil-DNA glycosylase [Candidatus Lambdaproteobacteria bacterium RIFOXYC1_FULL_56_13]OGH09606.1 MAG: uracil-DNA glycosylase [Candidatus Lambdaproteobacteria bacterium RIFOXYD1_FULL_56_27]